MIRFISYFIQLIVGLLLSLLVSSCQYKVDVNDVFSSLEGSENIISESRRLSNFTEIIVGQAIQVEITQSDNYDVIVETNDNVMPYLKTEILGDKLKIYYSKKFSGFNNVESKVKIKMPYLSKISASSASNIVSKNTFTGDNLQIKVSSAASVDLDAEYDDVAIDASSASTVSVRGMSLNAHLETSSAAVINTKNLKSNMVKADASSAGSINCWPILRLDAKASSGGVVNYYNVPQENSKMKKSSGGSITKK